MVTDTFQLAVQRARRNYTEAEWHGLTFSDQARAIYLELGRLDAEDADRRAREGLQPDGTPPGADGLLW